MTAYVGVDLGGTNIRAAVATGPATHGRRAQQRTPAEGTHLDIARACAETAHQACEGTPDGVVVAFPGPVNPKTGLVYNTSNLGNWKNVAAKEIFEEAMGCPVLLRNDASLAGYAEWVAGAGQGVQDMVFITVSTGIGGALICNGEMIGGAGGIAGEIRHTALGAGDYTCPLGHRGCLEATASGTAIAQRAREAVAAGATSTLSELAPEAIDGRAVEVAAAAGDALAAQIFHDAAFALGRAVGSVINLLNPSVVVIGGGVSAAGDLFFAPVHAGVSEIAFGITKCDVVPAGLGTDAGLVGACAWAMSNFA